MLNKGVGAGIFVSILLLTLLVFNIVIFAQSSLADEDSRFGIFGAYATEYKYFQNEMGYGNSQYWDWVAEHFVNLGAHWTRSNLQLVWDEIEPALDSTYNWNPEGFQTDSIIINIYTTNNNVHWLGVFHEGSLLGQRPDRPPLRNPLADSIRYQRFVQNAVERYDGDGTDDVHPQVKVKYWQIGNEFPNNATEEDKQNYVRWVKLAAEAIHQADSSAKIVLIAQTQSYRLHPWLKDVIVQLQRDRCFDVIDIHHWGRADEYRMEAVPQARKLLDSLGLNNVQIWSCENGTWAYQPEGQPYQSQKEQARSLIKRYVTNIDLGLDKLFWNNLMEWKDFNSNPGSVYNSMGLIGDGQCNGEPPQNFNQPRISYFVYKFLAQKIDTRYAKYLGKLDLHHPPEIFAYHYKSISDDSLHFFILWSEQEDPQVNLKIGTPQATVLNMISDSLGSYQKQRTLNVDENGEIRLLLGKDPIIVSELNPEGMYQTEYVEVWVRNIGTESNNGNRIFTRIHQPKPFLYPGEKFPAVIFVPGGLGPGAMYQENLAEQGMVVVHFNAEGRVSDHPDDKKSEGMENFNGKIHQDDLKAVIDYVLALDNVQPDNVGIYSSSYGITMAAGCLGRYPELPVKYLVDNEGPSDSRVTCFDYWHDPERTQRAFQTFGHYSTAKDSSAENLVWWSEREAVRFIGNFKGYYLRIQSQVDHAQPAWFHQHAIDMINAATNTQHGGSGQCHWTRVNGVENNINAVYDSTHTPIWLDEQIDRRQQAYEYILELAAMSPLTSVSDQSSAMKIRDFTLLQNYPNPFNQQTVFRFYLPQLAKVELKIINQKGQIIRTLVKELMSSGSHAVIWTGKNEAGREVSSGIYFCQLIIQDKLSSVKKVVLIK